MLGSFATASCTQCGHKVSAETIKPDVFEQRIPRCPICVNSTGKIIFFFHITMNKPELYLILCVIVFYFIFE